MSIDSIRKMPRSEKLKFMEALWEDLSQPEDQFESPGWHAEELARTEQRLSFHSPSFPVLQLHSR